LSVVIRAEKPKAIKLAKSASGFSGDNLSPKEERQDDIAIQTFEAS
jgi:hypothetical protein